MNQLPILFILGPSGAGKTTLADYLTEQLGILHFNFDRPDCNGVDQAGFRNEWNSFLNDRNPNPLATAIQHRVQVEQAIGASVTCPSGIAPSTAPNANGVELSNELREQMVSAGFQILVLYGTSDDCIASFLCREAKNGRGLGRTWWDRNNTIWQNTFHPADFPGDILNAFYDGHHRPLAELVAEIRVLLGRNRKSNET